jgi:hypothetical protein
MTRSLDLGGDITRPLNAIRGAVRRTARRCRSNEAAVTGRNPDERTAETPIGRLWPSDHAGVVVRLRP